MDYVIEITEHAFERTKERSGLNKKASVRLAERAYEKGITHAETNGNLYKYVSSIANKSNKGCKIRIYGDKVFVFNTSNVKNKKLYTDSGKLIIKLVTVLPIPNNLMKRVDDIRDKKRSQ